MCAQICTMDPDCMAFKSDRQAVLLCCVDQECCLNETHVRSNTPCQVGAFDEENAVVVDKSNGGVVVNVQASLSSSRSSNPT